ncbi:hypothetical protein HQ81_0077 [Dickeya phage phiDP23.1]|uniref:Uncharacterized protein n=14 Tax=Aglimvirinae TaxID=2169530 RepID=A0A7L4YGV7_9CAUD|nr:hypothetical protein DA66_0067 [Dickeya phage RC-2014]AIM51374.1 hypothetical protein HQ80_0099 [Dickeya phage phiD3]AIM51626.1 hypothetical protein HQ82_0152 [Dickeya phage phiDP10.3]AIM51856.1 hypothetical protein HQ81_0077 [Dickeya phage phiDP23.1]ASD51287.1 hypothetical protein [Dickeya phage JA15]ATW62105.1 hypothetical protein [Dickeya phage PP35]AYN55683.1 hypothetical protein [Dickeya phage Kamild]QHB41609.1 hypothetical protein [Dickeya phage Ds5CZ]QHB41811.1 hypothetical protei
MKKDEELALFSMVRSEVETGFRETDAIIDLMKVKNDIDNERYKTALYGLLEFVLRKADLGPVDTLDDLTKLLNTGGEGFDTARILIDGGPEEDEV